MGMIKKLLLVGALALLCQTPLAVQAATLGGDGQLLAQQGPPGMGQPGMQQGQPGRGQPGMGQPGGMQPGAQGGGNTCMDSYQRCAMMCAGVASCINNCNMGYAVCTKQPQNVPRPGGS